MKYGESINYLPYLLAYNFFNAMYIALAMFVYYSKKTKYLGILTLITAILQVLLLVYFIPQFGTIGAPISGLIVSMVTVIFIYFLSNKAYPMPWFVKIRVAKV
jgi:O-antigen/teichoic acid export membrane protein